MNLKNQIKIIGLKDVPFIKEGDNIPKIIIDSLKKSDLTLENGDVLVIAQIIISKSNGRIKSLNQIKPSEKAIEIYERITPNAKSKGIPIKEPQLIQAILDESKEIIKAEHVLITETKHGFVCANAGIDKSNVEGEENIALLPENPDKDASFIRKELKTLTDKDTAVIISDSFGRSFRVGAVGVAVGVSGIVPILDKRGNKDLFGHELQSTIIAQADSLASAAQLIMGEADEGMPVILIRGYHFELDEGASIKPILREQKLDLFRGGDIEYFNNILRNRRSYKLPFESKHVDKNIIEECIEVARWAPSAHNGQFWRYIIMDKGNLREVLIDEMNKKLGKDLEKDGKSEAFINNKIKKTRNDFLNAPLLILLCLDNKDLEKYTDSERSYNEHILGIQSISASATYLLLTFQSKGLAACWYCAPLFAKELVKDIFNLPNSYEPMAFFTVGYPIKTTKAPTRRKIKDIIFEFKNKE